MFRSGSWEGELFASLLLFLSTNITEYLRCVRTVLEPKDFTGARLAMSSLPLYFEDTLSLIGCNEYWSFRELS